MEVVVTLLVIVVVIAVAAAILRDFISRKRLWHSQSDDSSDWDDQEWTGVREPRRPAPTGSAAAAAAVPDPPEQDLFARGREIEGSA